MPTRSKTTKALIIGGAGFVGKRLVQILLDDDRWQVVEMCSWHCPSATVHTLTLFPHNRSLALMCERVTLQVPHPL